MASLLLESMPSFILVKCSATADGWLSCHPLIAMQFCILQTGVMRLHEFLEGLFDLST
jgi:hypothetical protein